MIASNHCQVEKNKTKIRRNHVYSILYSNKRTAKNEPICDGSLALVDRFEVSTCPRCGAKVASSEARNKAKSSFSRSKNTERLSGDTFTSILSKNENFISF